MGFLDRLKKKPKKEEKISGDWIDEMVEITKENAKRTPTAGGAIYTMPAKEYLSKLEQWRAKKQNIGEIIEEWNTKGAAFVLSKKYEEAIKCYDKALELHPNIVDVWCSKGTVFMHLENNEEAIKCFDKAIELDPDHIDTLFHLAIVHYEQGRREESIECYKHISEFIERNVETPPEVTAFDMVTNTQTDEEIGHIQLLIEVLDRQGQILGALGRVTEALMCFERILELDPNDVSCIHTKNIINEIHKRINS